MLDSKNERPRWSPDSWVKIILVSALVFAFCVIILALSIRALVPAYEISSEVMGDIFNRFIALFAVVVGYVLGSKRD